MDIIINDYRGGKKRPHYIHAHHCMPSGYIRKIASGLCSMCHSGGGSLDAEIEEESIESYNKILREYHKRED